MRVVPTPGRRGVDPLAARSRSSDGGAVMSTDVQHAPAVNAPPPVAESPTWHEFAEGKAAAALAKMMILASPPATT
jgi:hypothetical protein